MKEYSFHVFTVFIVMCVISPQSQESYCQNTTLNVVFFHLVILPTYSQDFTPFYLDITELECKVLVNVFTFNRHSVHIHCTAMEAGI